MVKQAAMTFYGRVQGVGFRFTAENLAVANNIKGFVRNLPDGNVEVVAEGEEGAINTLLQGLNDEMGRVIEKYAINWFPATGEFKRFEIRSY